MTERTSDGGGRPDASDEAKRLVDEYGTLCYAAGEDVRDPSYPPGMYRDNGCDAGESRLLAFIASLEEDGRRLDWLASQYAGADFRYGESTNRSVLIIDLPDNGKVLSDLRDTVDSILGEPRAASAIPRTTETEE